MNVLYLFTVDGFTHSNGHEHSIFSHTFWGAKQRIDQFFFFFSKAAGPAPAAALKVLPNCFGSCITVQECNTDCIAKNFKSGVCIGLGSDYACCCLN